MAVMDMNKDFPPLSTCVLSSQQQHSRPHLPTTSAHVEQTYQVDNDSVLVRGMLIQPQLMQEVEPSSSASAASTTTSPGVSGPPERGSTQSGPEKHLLVSTSSSMEEDEADGEDVRGSKSASVFEEDEDVSSSEVKNVVPPETAATATPNNQLVCADMLIWSVWCVVLFNM